MQNKGKFRRDGAGTQIVVGLSGKRNENEMGGKRRRWKNIKTKAVSRTREKKDQWEVKNEGRGKRKLR